LSGGKGKSGSRPSARANRGHDALAQARRRNDEAERKAGRHLLRQAVERDAAIRRERGHRRFFVEEAIDRVLDDGEAELLDDTQQIGPARLRHGHAERILNRWLDV
jgi:hypothetical protein